MKARPRMVLAAIAAVVAAMAVTAKLPYTSARFFDQEVSGNNTMQAISGWMDFAWRWRVPISVSNPGPGLSDYQLRITLNTAALVAAGKMQATGNDVRFTTSDGLSLMPYWIDSGINTSSTVIWVRVPVIPAGTSTIFMYYGNAAAPAASSGDSTFMFFDDFESGFVPDAKWTVINPSAGTASLSAATVFQGTRSLRLTDSPNGLNLGVSAAFAPQTRCVIDFAIYFTVQGSKEIQVRDTQGNIGPLGAFVKSKGGSDALQYYVTGWNTIGNFAAATWYQSTIVLDTSIDRYRLYFRNSAGTLLTQAENIPFYNNADLTSVAQFLYLGTSDFRTDTYLDAVRVRTYAATEPTYAFGVEQ